MRVLVFLKDMYIFNVRTFFISIQLELISLFYLSSFPFPPTLSFHDSTFILITNHATWNTCTNLTCLELVWF